MDERPTYEDDFYGWSQQQADVLRRFAGRPDLPNDLDLTNVIEEIEGVGSSQLNVVQSYLRLIFVHLIELACDPDADPHHHWQAEIIGFHADLLPRYSPSMRQNIDIAVTWRRALNQARVALAGRGIEIDPGLAVCPYTLDDFLTESLDLPDLRRTLDRATTTR